MARSFLISNTPRCLTPGHQAGDDVASALAKRAEKIISHMNEDHADSIKAYLRHFCKLDAEGGELTAISEQGMTMTATLADGTVKSGVFLAYSGGPLKSAGLIRPAVVAMHREAYDALGFGYKLENGYYQSIAGHIVNGIAKSQKAQLTIGAILAGVVAVGMYVRSRRQS